LIALDAAGSLAILERLYSTIAVPDAVVQECGGALPACHDVEVARQSRHLSAP
jgi:predicted nucleic acid-binding protein